MIRLVTFLAASAVLAGAATSSASDGSAHPTFEVGRTVQVSTAAGTAGAPQRCGAADPKVPLLGAAASVTSTPDGLVASWLRTDNAGDHTSAAAGLISPDGRVQPYPSQLVCPGSDDGRSELIPSIATDRSGHTYLASVLQTPRVAALAGTPVSSTVRSLRVAVMAPRSSRFGEPVVVTTPLAAISNVTLTADPFVAHRMWLTWVQNPATNIVSGELDIARTDDSGKTWTAPVTVTVNTSAIGAPFGPRLAVPSPGHLVVAVAAGSLGSVINQPVPASPSRSIDIVTYASADSGSSWSLGSRALTVSGDRPDDSVTGNQLRFIPTVAIAAAGTTVAVVAEDYHATGPRSLPTAVSTDGGRTWHPAVPVTAVVTGGGSGTGLYKIALTATPTGCFVASWTRTDDTPQALRQETFVAGVTARSLLLGASWSAPVSLGPVTDRRASHDDEYFYESNEITATRSGVAVAHQQNTADSTGGHLQVFVTPVRIDLHR